MTICQGGVPFCHTSTPVEVCHFVIHRIYKEKYNSRA